MLSSYLCNISTSRFKNICHLILLAGKLSSLTRYASIKTVNFTHNISSFLNHWHIIFFITLFVSGSSPIVTIRPQFCSLFHYYIAMSPSSPFRSSLYPLRDLPSACLFFFLALHSFHSFISVLHHISLIPPSALRIVLPCLFSHHNPFFIHLFLRHNLLSSLSLFPYFKKST